MNVIIKSWAVKGLKSMETRQVYNGPGQSNLSQQYENKFWSKMIFEQKKSRNA